MKIDQVVYAARDLVQSMTEEEKAQFHGAHITALIEAVEAAHLRPDARVWCLRDSDPLLPSTVRFWAYKAEGMGIPTDKVTRALRFAHEVEEFQADHLLLVKMPD